MTMHKSKGLTFDEVIIIGLNERFPSNRDDSYWYKTLYKSVLKEQNIEQAEERRLFYVALTRTKNKVYLLVDENIKRRSSFIQEINDIIINKSNNI
jgi:DNA helicase-4